MEWSLSKIMRIESGEVTISPNDLRPLLAFLGVADRDVVAQLIQDSKISRRRRMWWDEPHFRDELTPATRQAIQYEVEATTIRHYTTMLVPGVLQTREYATAVLNRYNEEISAARISARIDARLRRRQELMARRDPPVLYVLADESVIRRGVGGPQVVSRQLADLADITRLSWVHLRIMPFAVDAPLSAFGSFDIFGLSDQEDDAVMYRESHLADEIVEDRNQVARHRGIFDRLWAAALIESESVDLLTITAKSVLDGGPR
jgi:hypothetical protein